MPNPALEQLHKSEEIRVEPPRPLTRDIGAPQPYPVEYLGESLAPVALAIQNKIQAPLAICAHSVLAVASFAVQGYANVELIYGGVRPLSLFLVTIAASGQRKSSADNEAMKAIYARQDQLAKLYSDEKADYDLACLAHEKHQKKALGKGGNVQETKEALEAIGPKPAQPLSPMLIVPDPTIEGLLRLFVTGQPSLALFSEEGGQMIAGHALSAENKIKSAAAFSQLWDGQTINRVRVVTGCDRVANKRLALHLMIQPKIAHSFFGDADLGDQGLLSRILAVAPEPAIDRLFRDVQPYDQAKILNFKDQISDLLERPFPIAKGTQNELEPRVLKLTTDAKRVLVQANDSIETKRAFDPIRAFANKAVENATRLAGVLACIEDPDTLYVNDKHALNAVCLIEFYLEEALRLHEDALVSLKLKSAQKLLDWLHDHVGAGAFFPLHQVYQSGPHAIRSKDKALAMLMILEEHGWIVRIEEGMEIDGIQRKDVWRLRSAEVAY